MTNKSHILLFFTVISIGYYITTSFVYQSKKNSKEEKVLDVLYSLEAKMPLHYIPKNKLDSIKIKQGFNLVTTGYTEPNNSTYFNSPQSKHFVCTDCHNIQREDPDLTKSNPETRLSYVYENDLKFLPATTLYGTVNKNHWYNEDYFKKYGDLVTPARDTLENAIQLCAVVCSQGRALNDTEMEATLHFLNSIGYSLEELNLSKAEQVKILVSENDTKKEAIEMIKSKYLDYSPATFMKPQKIAERGLGKNGNRVNGKKIYELSCMTCHKEDGVTNYKLHNDKLTHKHLKYWANTHKVFSVYDITRKGTYSKNGYKPYMPNYTKERLSDQQLEDLMAYINYVAETGKTTIGYVTPGKTKTLIK